MSASSQIETPARERLEELFRAKFAARRIDIVAFADELFAIAKDLGEIRCVCTGEKTLRFEVRGQDPFEVPLDHARGSLRSLCAHLAVLVGETAGQEFQLYGGEGLIVRSVPAANGQHRQPLEWRFHMHHQNSNAAPIEFTITAL